MRIHLTEGFSAARNTQRDTYEAYHAIFNGRAESEWAALEKSDEAQSLNRAEDEALNRFLSFPATTPSEILAKLSFLREKEMECASGYPDWMAQIERELIELQRPCVSPAMTDRFNAWASAWAAYNEDSESDGVSKRHSAAFLAMMQAPCFTPGDFIVKVYANQLGEHGPTYMGPGREEKASGSFMFELETGDLSEGTGSHDGAAAEAFARDIRESDLGRCLLMLGRVDFDAEAWFAAARRVGMFAHVLIQTDGKAVLWTGQPEGEITELDARRFDMCQSLLGAGMAIIGKERRDAVVAHIAAAHPSLVADCRTLVGEAA